MAKITVHISVPPHIIQNHIDVIAPKRVNWRYWTTKVSGCIQAGIQSRYVTKPTSSTQPCIPSGSLNQVPALIGWSKGGNVTSAGWQLTLCDPIHGV